MDVSIIYGARCIIDGKWYIGKTNRSLEERKKEHLNSARPNAPDLFHRTLAEMGVNNFEWKELERCPKEEVLAREKEWIVKLAAQSVEDLLNKAHTRKRDKPSGAIDVLRIQRKIAGARAWQKQSAKQWMQRSGRLRPCINMQTGEKFESLLEAERKGPDSRSGIIRSCKTGRPTVNGNFFAFLDIEGNPELTEGHKKPLPRTQRVKNLNTGKIYNSTAEASNSTGASKLIILGCCKGKYKTASGIVFCFVDDNDEEMLTETHKRYKAEKERQENIAYAAWRIEDTERKHLVIEDTIKKLAERIEISRSHIPSICRGERQHDRGWRVALYNKTTKQLDLKEAHTKKIRKRIRKVICLDDKLIFNSFSDAATHYGLDPGQIQLCCDGILKGTGRNREEGIKLRFAYIGADGKPILTSKHMEPFEWRGDFRLFCPQTGIIYQSVAHCSRELHIPQKRIRRYLKDQSEDLAGYSLIVLPSNRRTA